ncbi:methyl-accepting chemotaxis protein [Agaricicola taiwanensis]|uniref:Methyl-accepting chemotaxis protein n=1 Tax=Agaricicola taiwanensis TaxID=591372 RepID=A0A8J2YJV1_9RHOB|nr:methyl-accepting chemotaxis protein [Agaricicola taiwanensis]GGE49212.1 methyl-accepting chemotaxis protein [Agaricicola taiwanensis]
MSVLEKVRIRTIGSKLMLATTATALAAACAVGLASYMQQNDLVDMAIEQNLSSDYQSITDAMAEQGQRAMGVAYSFANDPVVADAFVSGDRAKLLAAYAAVTPVLKSELNLALISFHKPTGDNLVRLHAPDVFGDNVFGRRLMLADVAKQGKPLVGIEPGRDSVSIFASVPVIKDGVTVGIVDIGAPLGAAFLADVKKRFDVDVSMNAVSGDEVKSISSTFEQKTLLDPAAHKEASTELIHWRSDDMGDRPVAVLAGPLKNYSGKPIGSIELVMDRSEFAAARSSAMMALALVLLGVAAVGTGVAVLLTRHLGTPIRGLTGAMARLAKGEWDAEVPGITRSDEIGEMAKAVLVFKENGIENERMTAEREAENQAKMRRAQKLDELTKAFERNVTELTGSLSSAATEMEASAQSMTAIASQTNSQSVTVASAAEQTSANVQTVASATEELSISVREIVTQISQSSQIAGRAVEGAQRTNTMVQSLSDTADKIGDVVALINSIAAQTNLLALNATIEAARAGEAGKGFAVVASEVKELAGQTSKATDEIGARVTEVQTATREAIAAIQEISKTINDMSQISATIAAAMEEQGAATSEIARNVQEAARGTEQVTGNIGDVRRGAGETGTAASQVLSAAQQLARHSSDLGRELDTFLTGVKAA